jgi:RpiB/LacA/LacB family sugar-phosphate isomerase
MNKKSQKIFIGADHRGFKLKEEIMNRLIRDGYVLEDMGTHNGDESCDYPRFSFRVASQVASKKGSRGILICMSGIGHTIAANKVKGAYAALCYNRQAAALSREHNDSNILVLGSKFVSKKELNAIISVWLKTPFAGGRHRRRVNQIRKIEQKGKV